MLDFPRWKTLLITASCFLFIVLAIPSFMSEDSRKSLPDWLPQDAISLGLDLQGGSQLLLEIDFDTYIREQMTNLVDEVRRELRASQIGYRNLSIGHNKVSFILRNETDAVNLEEAIKKISPHLIIENDDKRYHLTYDEAWYTKTRNQVLELSKEIINRRVNETGTKEPTIQRQGDLRILLQVPGLEDPEHLKNLLGKTAKMTFHLLNHDVTAQDLQRGIVPYGTRIINGRKEPGFPVRKYPVISRVMLSGDLLVDAHTSFDDRTNEPVVAFRFNNQGARKFGQITSDNVNKPFAVVLDNQVITAPVIRSAILGGSGIISGGFDVKGANELALLLRAGALPAPLEIIEERSVGPSLGADSIAAGTNAAIIAIILVIIFMVLFYGIFGVFANIAMVINAFMIISILAMFGATLTLPGIAGIVLTIGMAVDANVLIYERIREEKRNGKTVHASINDGFKIAFGTILDAQITTLVAALILYYFGTGSIKGFAVTLSVGIFCSLFTAILVTRLMVVSWLNKKRPKQLPI